MNAFLYPFRAVAVVFLAIFLCSQSLKATTLECEGQGTNQKKYYFEYNYMDGNDFIVVHQSGRSGPFRLLLLGATEQNRIRQAVIVGEAVTGDVFPTKERFELRLPKDTTSFGSFVLSKGPREVVRIDQLLCPKNIGR